MRMARFDRGFTKLDKEILLSTVWVGTDLETKVVWITLLALANWDGYVGASLPGIAATAGVALDRCAEIMGAFEGPDHESRSDEYEGRRLLKVDRGWEILNYPAFRDGQTPEQRKNAERMREWRAKKAGGIDATV